MTGNIVSWNRIQVGTCLPTVFYRWEEFWESDTSWWKCCTEKGWNVGQNLIACICVNKSR